MTAEKASSDCIPVTAAEGLIRLHKGSNMDIKFIKEHGRGMAFHRNGDVLWLSFPALDQEEWLLNAFSTRFGGVSTGHLASMNLSFAQEKESRDNVLENFRRFAAAAGFRPEDIVCSDQTHTTNVDVVTRRDRGRGIVRDKDRTDIDGMITNEPGVVLATFYADCVPLFFADPVHRCIGLSHSGWRGTADRMAAVTIEAMRREFGTDPKDLYAAIGPCICQDCYEVDYEVARRFPSAYVRPENGGKYRLDLAGVNRGIMAESGIRTDHISMPGLCTCCNPDLLFSHRASKGRRGNLGAFLMIREKA